MAIDDCFVELDCRRLVAMPGKFGGQSMFALLDESDEESEEESEEEEPVSTAIQGGIACIQSLFCALHMLDARAASVLRAHRASATTRQPPNAASRRLRRPCAGPQVRATHHTRAG